MPPQKRAAARGRRDPSLLEGDQALQHTADLEGGEDPDDDGQGYDDNDVQVLFEGDHVRVSVSVPVTLGDMDRYSIVQAEALAHVQGDEGGVDTAGRALAAMRYSFFATVEQMEDDLRAYQEQQAADAARVDRQVRTGR